MKTELLQLIQLEPTTQKINTRISLLPFVHFLEKKTLEKTNVSKPYFTLLLKQIKEFPLWQQDITEENIDQFKNIFELIYYTFSAPITDQNVNSWALAKPLSWEIFFGTDALFNLLKDDQGNLQQEFVSDQHFLDLNNQRLKVCYSLILRQLYNFEVNLKNEIQYSYFDRENGLNKSYKLIFDARFIEISFQGNLPKLDFSFFMKNGFDEAKNLSTLQKIIPLGNLTFSGFAVVQVVDNTEEYTINQIKDNIVNLASGRKIHEDVAFYLKNLFQSKTIDVKLFPVWKVNNKLTKDRFDNFGSFMVERCDKYHLEKEEYWKAVAEYIENPKLQFYPDLSISIEQEPKLISFIRKMCIRSFAMIPIVFRGKLVGVLELISKTKDEISREKLTLLNSVIPLLEQLMKTVADEFAQTIDHVIKEHFTSLQPSVQWKFNEAALRFLENRQIDANAEMERVYFSNVYPLYGAIDVRDSTLQRNEALKNDLCLRLDTLLTLMEHLEQKTQLGLLDELIFKAKQWRKDVENELNPEQEFQLNLFFDNEAELVIRHLYEQAGKISTEIDLYFKNTKEHGKFRENRQKLENSLQTINRLITESLNKMNEKIQKTYPCYFEKFRSDGVEFDMYIGQSIFPEKKFDLLYLKNLRLLQLSTMAKIVKQTATILSKLEKPLQTTQLIFVHSNPIDISFRNEERRFDVEGAYNIRYEMTKKRIDKVHLKGSSERLTQPGTIAIVYAQKEDVQEYRSYISYLQEKEILTQDVEYLDLEDLQGISGLRALRVTVKI